MCAIMDVEQNAQNNSFPVRFDSQTVSSVSKRLTSEPAVKQFPDFTNQGYRWSGAGVGVGM